MDKVDKLIGALRNPLYPQHRDELVNHDGTSLCAMGLYLVQVEGYEIADHPLQHVKVLTRADDPRRRRLTTPPLVREELGSDLVDLVVGLNDCSRLTFAQIADELDGR